MAVKLEVFSLGRDVLSSFTQGIDPYASAKFRAFNTNWTIRMFSTPFSSTI